MFFNDKYSIAKGNRSRRKYLVGILGILFVVVTLFSCDTQDLGINSSQKPSSTTIPDQINSNATQPYSFNHDLPQNVPTVTLPPVNEQALLAEDRALQQQNRPVPPRFAVAQEVNIDINSAGIWTDLQEGGRLWRLRIISKEAYSMHLIFDRFKLPPGGELFIYSENQDTILGSFTEKNNKPHGYFSTLPIKGANITLEYYEPDAQQNKTELNISRVMHGYRDVFRKTGLGDSGSCNINVNCPEGNNWQDEKRAVAMIVTNFGQGSRICSGALVNNEHQDLQPYFLTAYHCLDGDLDGTVEPNEEDDVWTWGFWFNYESIACSGSGVGHDSMSGSDLVALNRDSDFTLLELNDYPPASYNTFYAGWDATGSTPNSSVTIHHPQGDIKKISIDNNSPVSSDYEPNPGPHPNNSHWKIVDWDTGTTEPGSSGAPLYNQNKRVVGQLHGGYAACGNDLADYYGKFSMSWDYSSSSSTRLKDWLDPNNTGIQQLNGIEGPEELNVAISGPDQVSEGSSNTWNATVSGGNPPYDSYVWYKKIGMGPWEFACTSSTTSCSITFEDGDSQTSQGYVKLEVSDEIPKYYGEDIKSVTVFE